MSVMTKKPEGLTPTALEAVRRACALIDAAEGESPPSLAALAAAVGQSPWHLQRSFKRATGVSPRDYAEARRSARFKTALREGEGVAAATYEAGYGSSSRVYEQSDRLLGMTPASYAKGGRGAEIAYATVSSSLGLLLVATTAQGICFVSLGPDEATLEALVREHAGDESPMGQQLLRQSLAAAFTPDELRDIVSELGMTGVEVVIDTDRHVSIQTSSKP